jgi:hypothetical protein
MYSVGAIARAYTKLVIGKDSAYKLHFCVCSKNRDYLYVCKRQFTGDYPITPDDCLKLDYASWISLSKVFHVPDWKMKKSELICTVNDEYLRGLVAHVTNSKILPPKDQTRILHGIWLHYNRDAT